ncbi:MAG: hypothetical protein JAZ11_03010 [Candidatus Thiodiazotropha lotti]|nr:hypothetical protein [Candidatus Thiodiazotropha lotti]
MAKTKSGGSSRPVIMQEATLASYQAQQVYKRSYGNTSRSFYMLTVVLRALANDDQAREVESVVDSSLDEMGERLTTEIQRLKKLCDDSGIEPTPNFNKPQVVEVEIASPRAARYLGLIKQLDHVIGLTSLLWLSGVRNDSQYSAECYLWQRNLLRLSNRVREIANRAIAAANRSKEENEKEEVGQEQQTDSLPEILETEEPFSAVDVNAEPEVETPEEKPAQPKAKKTTKKKASEEQAESDKESGGETANDAVVDEA